MLIFVPMEHCYDIIIVGGGPAGSAAAIELSKHKSISVVMLDAHKFPRDKICGDAIPGPTFKELKSIFGDTAFIQSLKGIKKVKSTRISSRHKKVLDIDWVLPAYNAPRLSLDNHLYQHAKEQGIRCFEGVNIRSIKKTKDGYVIVSSENNVFECKLIIGADGTNSVVRKFLSPELNQLQKTVGLRQYYEGVELSKDHNHVYFRKGFVGYFWAFPLGNDQWNIGYGVPDNKKFQKVGLKEDFHYFIEEFPELTAAFKNAKASEKIKGYKLACFSKRAQISGDGFMLCGDAAYLIDPAWGHGIDKAMISGRIAAEESARAFENNDLSSKRLSTYDKRIYKQFGKELTQQFLLVKYFAKYNGLLKYISPFLKLIDKRIS